MLCTQAQSLIIPYLENRLELKKKVELVEHIRGNEKCRKEAQKAYGRKAYDPNAESGRNGHKAEGHPVCGCKSCREELEFYFIVYVTTGMLEDKTTSGNYAKEVDKLFRQTQREQARAAHMARMRRVRLFALLLLLCVILSFGVGRTAIRQKQEPILAVRTSFILEGLWLPDEIYFVRNAIRTYHEAAFDFTFSQQTRGMVLERMRRMDMVIMRAMKSMEEFQYEFPDDFIESNGSFLEKIIAAKRPPVKPSGRLTLKPIYFLREE